MSSEWIDTLKGAAQKISDPYDRQARLYPSLLVVAPIPVMLVCLYGAGAIVGSTIVALLGSCGIAFVLGRVAREAGKRIEPKLYEAWGGAPTTQVLRHRDQRYDPHTKQRFHAVLGRGLKIAMPTREQEDADPTAADDLYRAATTWLIKQTRDTKKYPLVFKENINFGFQRNALGLKPWGLLVCILCVVWALMHAEVFSLEPLHLSVSAAHALSPAIRVSLLISAAIALIWIFLVTRAAARRVGFAYAERLIEASDSMKTAPVKALASAAGKGE